MSQTNQNTQNCQTRRKSINSQGLGIMQIAKLQNIVQNIFNKNKLKYKQIIAFNSYFDIDLYQPKDIVKVDKGLRKQILLKQIDKLMDQQAIFDKKLAHLNFEKDEQNIKVNSYLQEKINPYEMFRSVWDNHKRNSPENTDSLQKVQSLNFTIGRIKSMILAMKKIEQKQEKTQFRSIQPVNEYKINQKYDQLTQNNKELQITNNKLQLQLKQLKIILQQKNNQTVKLNQKIFLLQKQLKSQRKCKEESEITQKYQIMKLNENIFNFEKKIDKLQKWKKNLESNVYENESKGFKIYIEQSLNHPKIIQNVQKIIHRDLQQIDAFLRTQASVEAQSSQSQNLLQELDIPEIKQQEKKIQVSTDRSLTGNGKKTQRSDSSIKIKYSKVPTFSNEETNKKFVRRNQLDLVFEKVEQF